MTIFESVDSKRNDKQAAVIIIWPRLMMTEIPNQNRIYIKDTPNL